MGGKKNYVTSDYVSAFVRYIEIAEKVQAYKGKIVGLSRVEAEDVCGRLFGYSEKDLKNEELCLRK